MKIWHDIKNSINNACSHLAITFFTVGRGIFRTVSYSDDHPRKDGATGVALLTGIIFR